MKQRKEEREKGRMERVTNKPKIIDQKIEIICVLWTEMCAQNSYY